MSYVTLILLYYRQDLRRRKLVSHYENVANKKKALPSGNGRLKKRHENKDTSLAFLHRQFFVRYVYIISKLKLTSTISSLEKNSDTTTFFRSETRVNEM